VKKSKAPISIIFLQDPGLRKTRAIVPLAPPIILATFASDAQSRGALLSAGNRETPQSVARRTNTTARPRRVLKPALRKQQQA